MLGRSMCRRPRSGASTRSVTKGQRCTISDCSCGQLVVRALQREGAAGEGKEKRREERRYWLIYEKITGIEIIQVVGIIVVRRILTWTWSIDVHMLTQWCQRAFRDAMAAKYLKRLQTLAVYAECAGKRDSEFSVCSFELEQPMGRHNKYTRIHSCREITY